MTARTIILTCLIFAAPGFASAQERVDTVAGLELFSSFWPNLHHRLHADARDGKKRVSTVAMTDAARLAWEAAITYYATDLAKRDLRTGRDMTVITDALSREGPLPDDPALAPEHLRILERVAPVYREYLWPQDDRANRAWIADVASRLRSVESRVIPRLAAFYELPWYNQQNPARVDIVNVGAARGGYTWTQPRVHSVIDGADATYQQWLGVEMLLHEASHGMVPRLEAHIDAALKAARKDDGGLLWHVAQFYVVGDILRRDLAAQGINYAPYMYSTGLFDRAWRRFKAAVEANLSGYLDGTVDLAAALRQIVAQF